MKPDSKTSRSSQPDRWRFTFRNRRFSRVKNHATGFTFVELLSVLAIVALLAGLLLPSLAHVKGKAQSTSCRSNLKQLTLAWLSYVHDNEDGFPPNISRRIGFDQINTVVDRSVSWVLGNAKLDTNTAGVLFKHVGSAALYRCPTDKSTVRDYPSLRRKRSYSMDCYFNSDIVSGTAADTVNNTEYILTKASQLVNPGPSGTFVFIDEDEVSIDDGIFGVQIPTPSPAGQSWIWGSFPGDRHNNGANVSFADGHVESHHWCARRIITSYSGGKTFIDPGDTPNLEDQHWLWERIPRPP
jgi:prepilin-type processing-associated H-X9-DG protein